MKKVKIGVIGGSGIYKLDQLKLVKKLKIKTRYGDPSDLIQIYKNGNELVAFLPRHNEKHAIPPHKIPYKANIAALKSIGVRHIIATSIVGSLKKKIRPADFVVPDQFVNLTWGRDDYFKIDKTIIHLPMANPYCQNIRDLIFRHAGNTVKQTVHKKGTVAIIQGPRFSTTAESKFFMKQGWDIVNMTQYPEAYFAREMKICYATLCSVTDYDVGVRNKTKIDKLGIKKVVQIFKANTETTQDIISRLLKNFKTNSSCGCSVDLEKEYYKR